MQKEVLLGTLLGDAYIQLFPKVAKNGNRYYSFNWHQSIKEYALWKAELSETKYSIKTYMSKKPSRKENHNISYSLSCKGNQACLIALK